MAYNNDCSLSQSDNQNENELDDIENASSSNTSKSEIVNVDNFEGIFSMVKISSYKGILDHNQKENHIINSQCCCFYLLLMKIISMQFSNNICFINFMKEYAYNF